MVRFLLYLLIASEFLSIGAWTVWQCRVYHHRRKLDVTLILVYSGLSISYLAYGVESYWYNVASITGYVADSFVAAVLGVLIIRKVIAISTSQKS